MPRTCPDTPETALGPHVGAEVVRLWGADNPVPVTVPARLVTVYPEGKPAYSFVAMGVA